MKTFLLKSYIKNNYIITTCIGFTIGIYLYKTPALVVIAVLLTVIAFLKFRFFTLIIFIIFLLLGTLYSTLWDLNTKEINNSQVLSGRIIEPVERQLFNNKAVVDINNQTSHILIETESSEISYGQKVKFKADISKLDEDNSYNKYLNSKNIFYEAKVKEIEIIQKNNIFTLSKDINKRIQNVIYKNMGFESANLFNGILLGVKSEFSPEFKTDLKNSGTTHIVSASGFNVILIYIMLKQFSGIVNQRILNITSAVIIVFYSLIIGIYIIPALRAAIMLVLALLAKFMGRKIDILTLLAISISLILFYNPMLASNISLNLSILATIGLIIFTKPISKFFKFLPEFFNEIISSTIAVFITTTPIIFIKFSEISFTSLVSNIFIVPLIPIITYISIFALFLFFTKLFVVSKFVFYLSDLVIIGLLDLIRIFGDISIFITTNKAAIVAFYVLLFTLFFLTRNKKNAKISNIFIPGSN